MKKLSESELLRHDTVRVMIGYFHQLVLLPIQLLMWSMVKYKGKKDQELAFRYKDYVAMTLCSVRLKSKVTSGYSINVKCLIPL